ncbi:MAG: U32 family peptidase [Bacteriovoracaceae bacterium]|nr:U32 family peptidase [Bacteriovoracaceae bacterium]
MERSNVSLFCLPADFDLKSAKNLIELTKEYPSKKINEFYGSIPLYGLGSGRKNSSLRNISRKNFFTYISFLKNHDISFNYTLNAITLSNMEYTTAGYKKLLYVIDELVNAGVDTFTVSIPPLIELIKNHFPQISICASAILKIDSLYKIHEVYDMGADRFVLFEDATRDFGLLREIGGKSPIPCEIIINQDCLFGCISRDYHRTVSAIDNKTNSSVDVEPWLKRCKLKKYEHPEELIKTPTLIRPEDVVKYLDTGINFFKLTGRESYWKNFHDILKLYLEGENSGNFLDIIPKTKSGTPPFYIANKGLDNFLDFFVEGKNPCKRSCHSDCNYCNKHIPKTVADFKHHTEFINKQKKDYLDHGPYSSITSCPSEKIIHIGADNNDELMKKLNKLDSAMEAEKIVVTIQDFIPDLDDSWILFLRKINASFIFKKKSYNSENTKLIRRLQESFIEVIHVIIVPEEPDLELFLSSLPHLPGRIHIEWKKCQLTPDNLEQHPYQMEVFHRSSNSRGFLFMETPYNVPFVQAILGTEKTPFYRNHEFYHNKFCRDCEILAFCRGEYIDSNHSDQKTVCDMIKTNFSWEMSHYQRISNEGQ